MSVNEPELMWVETDKVVVPDHLLRSLDPEALDISDILPSVEESGIYQPLLGRWLDEDEGTVELVAGYRRLKAATEAGLAEIPFLVREMDDEEAATAELVENIARRDLPPHREAEAVIRILSYRLRVPEEEAVSAIYRYINAGKGLTQNALEPEAEATLVATFEQLGRKPSYFVTHILPATKWPQPVLRAVETGAVSRQAARQLAKIESEELLQEAVERVAGGEPVKEVVADVLGGASGQKEVSKLQKKADELEGWELDEGGYIVPPPPSVLPEATYYEALERPYVVREIIALLGWERGNVALIHPDGDDVQRALEAGCRTLWVDSSKVSEQAHRLGDVKLPERVIAFARIQEDRAASWGDPNKNDPTGKNVPVGDAVDYYSAFPVIVAPLAYAHMFGRRIEFVGIAENMRAWAVIM